MAKVKKRTSAVGGSARVRQAVNPKRNCCLSLFSWCLPKPKESRSIFFSSDTSLWPSSHQSSWSSDGGRIDSASSPENTRDFLIKKHSSIYSAQSNGQKKEVYYALKSIHLDRCTNQDFQMELKNEVAILKQMDHPNIVRAIETFHFHKRLFLVLELCSGGDLYTRDPYSEREALRIVSCLTDAVSYLHSKGIVHRDLKFENVMFTDSRKTSEIKIIDFGK